MIRGTYKIQNLTNEPKTMKYYLIQHIYHSGYRLVTENNHMSSIYVHKLTEVTEPSKHFRFFSEQDILKHNVDRLMRHKLKNATVLGVFEVTDYTHVMDLLSLAFPEVFL